MRLKVIGYTDYDDDTFLDSKGSWAERAAIVDDLKEHGYDYTGFQHQEYPLGAPVLSDGTVCRYSQRGWGDFVAEAQGDYHPMAYAMYAFFADADDDGAMPTEERNIHTLIQQSIDVCTAEHPETLPILDADYSFTCPHPELGDYSLYTLTEEDSDMTKYKTIMQVPYAVYKQFVDIDPWETYVLDPNACKIEDGKVTTVLTDALRYVNGNDTLIIGDNRYRVTDVNQKKDVPKKIADMVQYSPMHDEKYNKAVEKYINAPILVVMTVEEVSDDEVCNSPT